MDTTRVYLQCLTSETERAILAKAFAAAQICIIDSVMSEDDGLYLVAIGEQQAIQLPLSPRPDLVISFLSAHDFSTADAEVLYWKGNEHEFSRQLRSWFSPQKKSSGFELNIIGNSQPLQDLHTIIKRVSTSHAPVLLQGETGTGKEVAARSIHYLSTRAPGPFVPVNCGAYNDDLFIAELFGFERGAFTDAKKSHAGFIEQAEKGTLFLDEVNSLSPKAQVALLRFLQDKEYRPLGASVSKHADIRIVAASNKPEAYLLREGRFREDLFYRLDILSIEIPTLRQRATDIPILCQYFLERFRKEYGKPPKKLSQQTLKWMSSYEWPGNIRELENYLHKLFVLSDSNVIDVKNIKGLPTLNIDYIGTDIIQQGKIRGVKEPIDDWTGPFQSEKNKVIAEFEQNYVCSLLRRCAGNISKAARLAGKERRSFTRLIEKYGIDKNGYLVS